MIVISCIRLLQHHPKLKVSTFVVLSCYCHFCSLFYLLSIFSHLTSVNANAAKNAGDLNSDQVQMAPKSSEGSRDINLPSNKQPAWLFKPSGSVWATMLASRLVARFPDPLA